MKTFTVAGHLFEDRVDAVCIRQRSDGSACDISWQSIKHCRNADEYVGKPNIAHYGNATPAEILEIDAHAEREERAYRAIAQVCGT